MARLVYKSELNSVNHKCNPDEKRTKSQVAGTKAAGPEELNGPGEYHQISRPREIRRSGGSV